MKKMNHTAKTFTTVAAAATVLAVFGTGSAVAGGLITSAKIKNNTIKSIDVRDSNLKGVDVLDGSLTGADLQDGSLNGTDIADGSLSNQDVGVLYAIIQSNASVVGSSGGVTATQEGTGMYLVDFHRDITPCAVSATVGLVGEGFPPVGYANTSELIGVPSKLFVGTKNAAGALADNDFHLVIVC